MYGPCIACAFTKQKLAITLTDNYTRPLRRVMFVYRCGLTGDSADRKRGLTAV
jgi:hypothetical protein